MGRKPIISLEKYKQLIYKENLPFKEVAQILNVTVRGLISFRNRHRLPTRGWSNGRPPRLGSKMSKELKNKLSSISMKRIGDKNPRWCGNKRITYNGYVLIRKPEHPFADCNGWVREHRLVMEQHLNRILDRRENVHHMNGIKTDNRIENLVVCTNSEHHKLYHVDISIKNLSKSFSHRKHSSTNNIPDQLNLQQNYRNYHRHLHK